MIRLISLLILLAAALSAQVAKYDDVEFWDEKSPGKYDKDGGKLFIDRTGGGLVFLKGDEVRRAFGLGTVTGLRYHTKGDRMLFINYNGPSGAAQTATFKLGGNDKERDQVVMAIEAGSGKQVQRINAEWKK
ncbi:MAG: hypothetical protein MUC42_06215 [Bryobacter sp.]|jgi:hypothetical protein|nr:hypothetical protein [Bryobacter sp.]